MSSKLRRAGWLFLVLLFVITGLGVGVVGFWQSVNQPTTDVQPQNPPSSKKLQGTKLENYTPVDKIGNLEKIDIKVGDGQTVKAGSTVTVVYTGALAASGTIFESSFDSGKPVTFSLNQVIKGWTDGLPGMKVGGQRRLLIPAAQAYGATPRPDSGIPPNADLVFDITLLDVK